MKLFILTDLLQPLRVFQWLEPQPLTYLCNTSWPLIFLLYQVCGGTISVALKSAPAL